MGAPNSSIADGEPPAERRSLTHAGTCTERVKPIGFPPVYCKRESEPQGTLMGLWVKDGGRSESPLVMRGIGVESLNSDRERKREDNITPRESVPTSYPGRSSRERLANHFQEGKQMTAGYGLAGAPSSATKVHIVAPS